MRSMNILRRLAVAPATALVLLGISSGGAVQATQADPQPIAAYSLVAPIGASPSGLVARAVVPDGAGCPSLNVVRADGTRLSVRMTVRQAPATTGAAFAAFTACTADIPANVTQARIGSTSIPAAMPERIERMAIFGDTGCRMKGSAFQDCASADAWPLARISSSIAKEEPDLILFTGDFFYREAACPDNLLALCGGSPSPIKGMPFKDTDYSWAADVFIPMSPMLASAPIVVTRGNHEECERGGNGYFIYMDPRKGTEATCAPVAAPDGTLSVPDNNLTPTFATDIQVDDGRTLRLAIVDSGGGADCEPTNLVPLQRTRFERAQQLAKGREAWLVVHRPIAGWQPSYDCGPNGGWVTGDEAVASAGLLKPFQMMISSHIHIAQAVNIPGIPGQFVIGNGGTLLEPGSAPIPNSGPSFPGLSYPAPTSSWQAKRFGYMIASPASGTGWKMQMHDPSGGVFATCALASKRITCKDR